MKLNLLVKPVAEVPMGSSIIYLYPVSMGDVNDFCGVSDEVNAAEKFRMLLSLIASLSVPRDFREIRQPLPEELLARMSAGELEALAAAYVDTPVFDKVRAGNAAEGVAPLTRAEREVATTYLDRLLHAEAERHRRIFEKLNTL